MGADKTVGERTRGEWWDGLKAPFSGEERIGLALLLDAAFDSRGLRDGLERAAKLTCRFCAGDVPGLEVERRGHRWIHYKSGGGDWFECFAPRIQDAIRGEAE